jgi:hypothetical protein
VARGEWPTVQHLPRASTKIVKLKLLSIATGAAKADEVVPVLLIAERLRRGDADPLGRVRDVAEYGPLRLFLIPLETDAVCLGCVDDQVVDLHKRCELVLESVIRQRQSYRKKNQAAGEVLAFVERKYLSAWVSML